jgi:quinol monooxygenase YgiN
MHISRWALTLAVLSSLAAAPANAGDGSGQILVVTHLDIIPDFVSQAEPLIKQFVRDSRKDPGVKSFIVITWTPTTNHFQLIERFANQQAFDAHVSQQHTVKFRDDLQGFIGAPYDERLYSASRQ